jgi:hypothetical protein
VIPMASVQALAEVTVSAKTVAGVRERTYEEHRKQGLGYFRDSTLFVSVPYMQSALRTIPGVTVRGTPYAPVVTSSGCGGFNVYRDGHPITVEELGLIDLRSLAAMEMYTRRNAPSDVPGGKGCVIVFWTKAAMGK